MPSSGSPTMVRRQLGRRLRRLREDAGKTQKDVEMAKLASGPKIWRIEAGKTGVKVADIRTLCWFYGADQGVTDSLATLALAANERGWWEEYADVIPGEHQMLFGLEEAASQIHIYDSGIVNGLFQTSEYIKAIHQTFVRAIEKPMTEASSERFVQSRLDRQKRMLAPESKTEILAVLDAATLTRIVGSERIMKAQLARLCEVSQSSSSRISIRVIPWAAGAHAAHGGQFSVMTFDDPDDPAVVFVESHASARYADEDSQVHIYRKIFASLVRQSIPIEEFSP